MSNVIVIGGGAAGCMAAYAAASKGHTVHLLEKNEKIGKKIYITGKGRCNVTNASDIDVILANVLSNPKFLYSAIYTFTNDDVIDFFEKYDVPLKVERGNRVFPVSDHSSDIIKGLERALKDMNVHIHLYTEVKQLLMDHHRCTGVELSDGTQMKANHVIVATGGLSYPSTGSTGDGYRFAQSCDLAMVDPVPSLVPFETKESWVVKLQGLSLRNVTLKITKGKKVLFEEFGEMLFTHFGISGPLVLSASAKIKPSDFDGPLHAELDLKPAISKEELSDRLVKDFSNNLNKNFRNGINGLFPAKLSPVMVHISSIDENKKCNEITKEERNAFVELTKALPFTIVKKRDFKEAIITKGGVSVKEIDPSTMFAKKAEGLSFCGEVLDLDAYTGGYNLQIAWSTGYLAGSSIE